MQVGYVGLMKAINNFDLAYGRSLAAFAQPYVSGEIKRHFRDARWPIHVTRPAQDLAVELRAVTGQLAGPRPLSGQAASAGDAASSGRTAIRTAWRASLVTSSAMRTRGLTTCSACMPSSRLG